MSEGSLLGSSLGSSQSEVRRLSTRNYGRFETALLVRQVIWPSMRNT